MLLQEAVVSAVAAAEELIKKRSTQSDQDRMADDYLASIGPALAASKRPTALTGGGAS
jgi:hypothetical protein